MISDWRKHWAAAPSPGGAGFPFLFVQLSPYMDQACTLDLTLPTAPNHPPTHPSS